ncbi:MAG TPA: LOG family protein [Ignavibacteriales bacterium]|nr:LOG family protein [Ignavibacteriales bacterium]
MKLKKSEFAPVKAYNNERFLTSPSARILRIMSEFIEPQDRFRKNKIVDTIVFFGSARLLSKKDAEKELRQVKQLKKNKPKNYEAMLKKAEAMLEMSAYYEDAVELSRQITEWTQSLSEYEKRFIVCSGGGPGIMQAANKGASLAGGVSIGLNISIPFEQFINVYVPPELSFEFHYFFMRKFWFVYLAKALIVFPGGFGTMDEMMEVLTLLQTGKIKKEMKVIIYGRDFWNKAINMDFFLEKGLISAEDFNLFEYADTPDEAFVILKKHFEKHYMKLKKETVMK